MQSAETVSRQWDVLQKIPRLPYRITASELHSRLAAEYDVSLRTLQRDLAGLERRFPISCVQEGRTQFWYWMEHARHLEIPRMTAEMATTLMLAHEYLLPVMPAALLADLKPYFDQADQVLDDTRLKDWSSKVRILERGPMLIPPKVREAVRDVVYRGLLESRRVKARYQARERHEAWSYTLNPLGLVIRSGIFYLVATVGDYTDPRHFALHRMKWAKLLEQPVTPPKGFHLKRYIEDQESFAYPLSPQKIKLEALFDEGAAFHLTETKLSIDQTIKKQKDGRMLVKATVADTEELRWWLRGFGDLVEVLRPADLS